MISTGDHPCWAWRSNDTRQSVGKRQTAAQLRRRVLIADRVPAAIVNPLMVKIVFGALTELAVRALSDKLPVALSVMGFI